MSRIEPITFRPFTAEYELLPPLEPAEKKEDKNESPEYVSAYYMTTISSMQASAEAADNEVSTSIQSTFDAQKEQVTSTIKKWGQWLAGLFSVKKENKDAQGNITSTTSLGGAPKLDSQEIDNKKLTQAIADLNRDLIYRLKDSNEFEEEMRKGGSKKLDKLIFVHLFDMSMKQKNIKEETSQERQEDLLRKHQENQKIQKDFFTIWDDIKNQAKKSSFLGWINMGSTVGIAGLFALGMATSGAAYTMVVIALPLLSITQGVTKGAEGIIKYQNDLKSGKLFQLKEQTSENSTTINDYMKVMRGCDEEMAELLKAIRRHLENQSKAERIFHATL